MPLAADGFHPFTGQHYLLIGIFLVGAAGLVVLGRSRRGTGAGDRFDRSFAMAIVSRTSSFASSGVPTGSPFPNIARTDWITSLAL